MCVKEPCAQRARDATEDANVFRRYYGVRKGPDLRHKGCPHIPFVKSEPWTIRCSMQTDILTFCPKVNSEALNLSLEPPNLRSEPPKAFLDKQSKCPCGYCNGWFKFALENRAVRATLVSWFDYPVMRGTCDVALYRTCLLRNFEKMYYTWKQDFLTNQTKRSRWIRYQVPQRIMIRRPRNTLLVQKPGYRGTGSAWK